MREWVFSVHSRVTQVGGSLGMWPPGSVVPGQYVVGENQVLDIMVTCATGMLTAENISVIYVHPSDNVNCYFPAHLGIMLSG